MNSNVAFRTGRRVEPKTVEMYFGQNEDDLKSTEALCVPVEHRL